MNRAQKKARLKRINAQQEAARRRNIAAAASVPYQPAENTPADTPLDTPFDDASPESESSGSDISPSVMRNLGRKVGARLNSARGVMGRAGVAGKAASVAVGAAVKGIRQRTSGSNQGSAEGGAPTTPSNPPVTQNPINQNSYTPTPNSLAEQAERFKRDKKKWEEEDKKKKKSEKSEASLRKAEIFIFWLALLVHLFDVFFNQFNRNAGLAGTFLLVYIFLGALAALVFRASYEGSFRFYATKHTIVAIIAAGAPMLIMLLRNILQRSAIFSMGFLNGFDPVVVLLSIISVFPIFIIGVFTLGPSFMGKFWKALFIISVFLVFWGLSVQTATDLPDISGPMLNPLEGIVWYGENIFLRPVESAWNAITRAPSAIDKGIKRIYEPYFYGTVEDNKKDVQLGVYLKNLQPLVDTVLIEDREIIMYADVQAKTFTDDLLLNNYCYAEFRSPDILDRKTYTVRGTIDLAQLRIFDFEENTLTCRINRQQIETKDRMIKVHFNSTFNFHTWGFIDYTFMERNELMNRIRSGKNVAKELGISPTLNAVYTKGPLTLGMARATDPPQMPYGLNAEDPILPLFGVTMENSPEYRTRGAIQTIKKVVFHVPPPITLDVSSCNPQIAMQSSVDRDTGYTLYTAANIPVRSDSNYQTIRCRMNLPEEKLYEFLGEGGVAIATFAVEVEYVYEISEHKAVKLEVPIDRPR